MNSGWTGAASPETLKRAAAEAALGRVESGMVLGLGTGSTIRHFVDLLGDAVRAGRIDDLACVPTSLRTEAQAREAGLTLVGLGDPARIDLAIDGADEVSSTLDLIKGMGGALLREKMVAQAGERFIVIADVGKLVERLGTLSPLPVEVVEWGWRAHVPFLEALGARVTLREEADGEPVRSDNGHLFLDCRFQEGIADAAELDRILAARAGVVDSGLFLGMADEALIASDEGVRILGRSRAQGGSGGAGQTR